MSNPPNTFKDWQDYPATLDPVHIAWLKNAKKSKTAFAVADIEGVEISHKRVPCPQCVKELRCPSVYCGI